MSVDVAEDVQASPEEVPPPKRRISWPPVALFFALVAGYVVINAILITRYNLFDGDGPSRVAHAGFALMSRDPHLSAIGFVWNPLPSLIEIPLLPLHQWWPELKTYGLAGAIQSAAFMAGSVLLVRRIALDRGVGRVWRHIAIAAFALHPMVVTYGGSGLSEAAEIFFVLWCIRHLLKWVDSLAVGDLALAGIALGLGYLARYEVIVAAVGAAVLVAAVTLIRYRSQSPMSSVVLNVLIVIFPLGVAFLAWAATGWILTGELFATLTSQYGNTSQVSTSLARDSGMLDVPHEWMLLAIRTLAMQPFTGFAVAIAVVVIVSTRRIDGLIPIVTFGSILAFSLWGAYTDTTFGWFRYYMPAIPMVIVLALIWWTPTEMPISRWRMNTIPSRFGAAVLSLSLLVCVPVSAISMLDKDIGNHHLQFGLNSLLDPDTYPPHEQWYRRVGVDDRILAAYLDRQNLPDGSVLMDTFMNWGVWLASNDPKQFIIDTDFDYAAALNRPWDFGVRYLLVTNPEYNAAPDTVLTRYPTMWDDGAGIGVLVHSAQGAFGQEQWRLYRVVKPEVDEDLLKNSPRP